MEAAETVAAESSPAVVETPAAPQVDPLQEGPMVNWTRDERNEFRSTGKMPESKPKAAPAPAKESSEATAESAAESETAKQQEHTETRTAVKPKQTAEERIAQLEATIEKIRKGAGLERTAKPESSTTEPAPKQETRPQQPQNYQEWRKTFKAPQWVEEFAKANPEATYEDASAAMADFLSDVRDGFKQRAEQAATQQRETNQKIADAKSLYPNFDETTKPFVDWLVGDRSISPAVLKMVDESEIFAHLAYTLAGDKDFKEIATNEAKAKRHIALTEALIYDELRGNKASVNKSEVPPAKHQTSAPRPPAEVGGRATAPADALVSAAAANDFRAFKAELNRRSLARK